MSIDLYKIQQEKEKPRKKKVDKKLVGFSVQKKALEETGYLAKHKIKTKQKKS